MFMSLAQITLVEAGLQRIATRMPELSVIESLTVRATTLLGRELSARMDQWLASSGLSEIEFRALVSLFSRDEGDVSPSDLCAALAQSPANLTRVSDALVERGLITRMPSEQDRRRTVLRITPAGEQLVRELLPSMAVFTQALFRNFSAEDTVRLLSDLKRLFAALDSLSQYKAAETAP